MQCKTFPKFVVKPPFLLMMLIWNYKGYSMCYTFFLISLYHPFSNLTISIKSFLLFDVHLSCWHVFRILQNHSLLLPLTWSFFQTAFQATKPKTFSWDKLDAKLRAEGSLNTSAAIVGYPCDMGRLWKYRATWKKEFAFSDSIRQKNQQRMNKVLQVWRQRQGNSTNQNGGEVNPVVVGVHVRRTDYIKYIARKTGGGAPPGLKYYNNAFEYYRKKWVYLLLDFI